MRPGQLLSDPGVLLVICSKVTVQGDRDRAKGHGLHRCDQHDCCREWWTSWRVTGGTRDEGLIAEVRMYHRAEITLGLVPPAGVGIQDVDSDEGLAQLAAAGVRPSSYFAVSSPSGPNRMHVYGSIGQEHLRPLFGCDIREGWPSYVMAPGWDRGVDGAKYRIIAGKYGRYQTFPTTMLTSSMDPSVEQMQREFHSLTAPLQKPLPVGTTWYAQDHLEDHFEGRLDTPIGCWEREIDWRFEDSLGGQLSQRQREVRAYVMQASQRHRRLAVDVGQVEIAKALGVDQATVSRALSVLLASGALASYTDADRGTKGYVSPQDVRRMEAELRHGGATAEQVKSVGIRSLTRSYVVPGLSYSVSDRPRGRRAKSHYGRRAA